MLPLSLRPPDDSGSTTSDESAPRRLCRLWRLRRCSGRDSSGYSSRATGSGRAMRYDGPSCCCSGGRLTGTFGAAKVRGEKFCGFQSLAAPGALPEGGRSVVTEAPKNRCVIGQRGGELRNGGWGMRPDCCCGRVCGVEGSVYWGVISSRW
jgi:hypothetical protein